MIARVMDRKEWSKLEGIVTNLSLAFHPDDIEVVVVEDGEKVVATMAVMRVVQFENLWIHPEYRGKHGLVTRLWTRAIQSARKWTNWVWAASDTDHMSDIITRLGGKELPVKSYIIPIGGD
jgi:hypothetical protein